MAPIWLFIIFGTYAVALNSKQMLFALQIWLFYDTRAGIVTRALFKLLATEPPTRWHIIIRLFRLVVLPTGRLFDNSEAEYAPVASLLLTPRFVHTKYCLILSLYLFVQTQEALVLKTRKRYPLSRTLRSKDFQMVYTIKWATKLSDLYCFFFGMNTKDWSLRHALRNSMNSFINYMCAGGFWHLMMLLAFPLWMVLDFIIVYDTAMLLVGHAAYYFSSKGDVILGQVRHRLWFPSFVLCLQLLFIVIWIRSDDGLILIVTLYPAIHHLAFCLYLLDKRQPSFLAGSLESQCAVSTRSVYCNTCKETVFSRRNRIYRDRRRTHHKFISTLRESACGGCRICSVVWERRTHLLKDFTRQLEFWRPVTTYRMDGSIWLEIYSEDHTDEHEGKCTFNFLSEQGIESISPNVSSATNEETEALQDKISVAGPLSLKTPNTGSEAALKQARLWLQDCLQSHSSCSINNGMDHGFRPTRLVYIPDDFRMSTVKILHSNSQPSTGQYTTLSHRWGETSVQPVRLQRRLEKCFERSGILFIFLPKTFQDAIAATKALGIDYIWIDSLCIIQDDRSDWAVESRSMCDVYRHAVCNIAASHATNSTEGCFSSRDPGKLRPMRTRWDDYIFNQTEVFLDYSLYDRAWVLQESFLAPRSLDFGRGQIFWRCATMRASEVFPHGVGDHQEYHPAMVFEYEVYNREEAIVSLYRLNSLQGHALGRRDEPLSEVSYDEVKLWSRIVERYSRSSLTVKSDRVVAIAGIAHAMGPSTGIYLAGMWKRYLPIEFLWICRSQSRHVYPHRAPSWSWLSVEGEISYHRCLDALHNGEPLCTFTDAEVLHVDGPNGELFLQGVIKLEAKCLPAKWSGSWKEDNDLRVDTIHGRKRHAQFHGFPLMSIAYVEMVFDDIRDKHPPEIVFLIPISKSSKSQGSCISGLVVRSTPIARTYERLGVFQEVELRDMFEYDEGISQLLDKTVEETIALR